VVEHVNGVEMRVVVAAVLTVAANAVLVAQHLLKLGAHLTTALARLQVQNFARRSRRREARGRKRARGVETCKKLRVTVWHGKVLFCSEAFFLGLPDPPFALRRLFFPSL
jgi:hypothetical protein